MPTYAALMDGEEIVELREFSETEFESAKKAAEAATDGNWKWERVFPDTLQVEAWKKFARAEGRKVGWGGTVLIREQKDFIVADPTRPFHPALTVLRHTRPGYRKITTGEYVPTAYRRNFGWKNTYYQKAFLILELHPLLYRGMFTKYPGCNP